jgi:dTDP-4-dehydrorhamnose reductase
MTINGYAPGVMAGWAAARAIPFIHLSTDYVFDGKGDKAWREEDSAHPLSAYGVSKRTGEKQVHAAGGCSLIIRTSWVYAAAGGNNFLRTIVRLARERNELGVVADQIGAPTSAELIARSIHEIAFRQAAVFPARCRRTRGLVNLATSGETSWHGFASAIVAGLRNRSVALVAKNIVPISSDQYSSPAKRPLNSRLNITRLAAVFGITPPPWDVVLDRELDIVARDLSSV